MTELSILSENSKVNLLGLNRQGLENFFLSLGEKPYRAQQLLKWIHFEGASHFSLMTNFSKSLREKLSDIAEIKVPDVALAKKASDGTYKWLIKLYDGNCIETVFIPEKDRGTLCISSQVGCTLSCDFCSTGKQGFSRDLSAAEIIAQLWIAVRHLSTLQGQHDRHITNIVMMGMGEPLLNFDQVTAALEIMLDDNAYGFSKRKVTVSTAGVVPAMYQLREISEVALAVSLHAPNDDLRNQLVPLNKKYPLRELMQACRDYFKEDKRRSIMIEYVMLAGVNDSPAHAKELITLLKDIRVKVNLIPFNPFPLTRYTRSDVASIEYFRDILMEAGIHTMTRKTRGDDIDAACGQLVGKVNDRTRRQERYLRSNEQKVIGESL